MMMCVYCINKGEVEFLHTVPLNYYNFILPRMEVYGNTTRVRQISWRVCVGHASDSME